MNDYNAGYYEALNSDACRMAARMVPMVVDLLHPGSVLDVGCGQGAWMAEFMRQGVKELQGLDGEWVDIDHLLIPKTLFISHDITTQWPITKTYDLAVSLEVAEHLPESAADAFIGRLTKAAPAVLFSAAIPYQEGTHHVNCQWPAYWAEKFKANGFMALDPLRLKFWDDPEVVPCYAQNMILYLREDVEQPWPEEVLQYRVDTPLSLVHPHLYMRAAGMLSAMRDEQVLVKKNWKIFWGSVVRKLFG